MGDWTITIKGHGIHDNGRQEDADAMAAVFVGELRAAGHEVQECTFALTSKSLEPLVPAIESTQYRVASESEDGQRFLVGEAPDKQPIRQTYYPNGLHDPQPYPTPTSEAAA